MTKVTVTMLRWKKYNKMNEETAMKYICNLSIVLYMMSIMLKNVNLLIGKVLL